MIIINTRKLWTTGFAILTTIAILTVTYTTYGPLGIATLIATIFSITILPILTGLTYYKLKEK